MSGGMDRSGTKAVKAQRSSTTIVVVRFLIFSRPTVLFGLGIVLQGSALTRSARSSSTSRLPRTKGPRRSILMSNLEPVATWSEISLAFLLLACSFLAAAAAAAAALSLSLSLSLCLKISNRLLSCSAPRQTKHIITRDT